jgi:hypothetical protein
VISWQTTQAPATSSTKSVVDGITGSSAGGGGFPPETRETYYTNDTTYYTTENWSRTTVSSTESFADVIKVTFITDFTADPPGTAASEDPFNGDDGGQTVISLTKTRHLESSTVTTVAATKTTTASTTQSVARWTVTSSSFSSSTISTSALTSITQSTSQSKATTTTLAQTEIDPSYYATVYMADGSNEVLWCLDPSAATFSGNFTAASAIATTTTRTTFQPWSALEDLTAFVSGITYTFPFTGTLTLTAASQTNETATLPEVVSVHDFTNITTAETTAATADFQQLPPSTGEIAAFAGALEPSQSSLTLVEAQSVVAFRTTMQTRYANGGRVGPQFFNRIDTVTGASVTDSYATVSIASSNSNAVPTIEYEEIYSAQTITRKTDAGGVGFALKPQGITTSMGFTDALIIGQRGVAAEETAAAVIYNANTTLTLEGAYTALDDRNVTTIMPGAYLATGAFGEGIASLSGLNASFTLRSSTSESTGTFSLTPAGISQTVALNKSSVIGGGAGFRETIAHTIAPGVYSDIERSSTFSTSGGVFSSTGTVQASVLQPLSFIVPGGTDADESPILWTATRNRTEAP